MATIKDHSYAILTTLNPGGISDDNIFPIKLIEQYMNINRNLLTKRKADRGQLLSDSSYLTFCIELEPARFHDCSCVSYEHDCLILKSKLPIPNNLSTKDRELIDIRFIDGTKIDETSYSIFKESKHSLTGKNTTTWFRYNGYIYITGTLDLKVVLGRIVPENPDDISRFRQCDSDESCYTEVSNYPIDSDLVMPMYQMTIEQLTVMLKLPQDDENNARAANLQKDEE